MKEQGALKFCRPNDLSMHVGNRPGRYAGHFLDARLAFPPSFRSVPFSYSANLRFLSINQSTSRTSPPINTLLLSFHIRKRRRKAAHKQAGLPVILRALYRACLVASWSWHKQTNKQTLNPVNKSIKKAIQLFVLSYVVSVRLRPYMTCEIDRGNKKTK